MAIGVSYTGHDGRRVDFSMEGNPAPGSALDNIVRGAGGRAGALTPLADAMRRARRPSAPDPRLDKAAGTVRIDQADQKPGTLSEKLMAGGSIEASFSGLRLKGEDGTGMGGVYARSGTRQGFLSLDEIDNPSEKGGVVGEPDAMNRLAPTNQQSSPSGPFGVNIQSRTEAEVDDKTGEVTLWEYTKRLDVTKGRRVGEVGGETKRKICSFFLGGDGVRLWPGERSAFTMMRSSYVDGDGVTRHEYWIRNLKWQRSFHRWNKRLNGTIRVGAEGVQTSGAYSQFVLGHYPSRPSDRPSLIEFDGGVVIPYDLLVENRGSYYGLGWTYIGSDVEFPDGNFNVYGYLYRDQNVTLNALMDFLNSMPTLNVEVSHGGETFETSVGASDIFRQWCATVLDGGVNYYGSVERFFEYRMLAVAAPVGSSSDVVFDKESLSAFIKSQGNVHDYDDFVEKFGFSDEPVMSMSYASKVAEVRDWELRQIETPYSPNRFNVVWLDGKGKVKRNSVEFCGVPPYRDYYPVVDGRRIDNDTVMNRKE